MAKKVDDDSYRVDEADPVSRFVTDRFKVNGEPGAGIAEYLWHASYVDHVKKFGMDAAR